MDNVRSSFHNPLWQRASAETHKIHCTIRLSLCKNGIRDSNQIFTTEPIFLLSNFFRQKYLEIASCAVSLLNNIWV